MVRFVGDGGLKEESFEVRGGHEGLFSAGAFLCRRSATAALFAAVHPTAKGPNPEGLSRTVPNRSSGGPVQSTGQARFDETPHIGEVKSVKDFGGEWSARQPRKGPAQIDLRAKSWNGHHAMVLA